MTAQAKRGLEEAADELFAAAEATVSGARNFRAELCWKVAQDVRQHGPHNVADDTLVKLAMVIIWLRKQPKEET